MGAYLGDYAASAMLDHGWASTGHDGSVSLGAGTSLSIKVYKGSSLTERSSSAGITLTGSFDSQPGQNHCRIDLSDNTAAGFWAAGSEYQCYVYETIDAVATLYHFHFSIERAGGALAVVKARLPAALTANGNMKSSLQEILTTALTETAGLLAAGFKKFFNVSAPTGTVNSIPDAVAGAASGLAIVGSNMGLTDGVITADKIAADAITAAKIADGAIDAGTFAAGAITAAAIAADAITDAKVAGDVTIASVTGSVGSVTGNVGGNVVGSVASVTAGVTLAASAVQAIWDALTTALTTVGSIGKLLVDRVDAAISTRATPAQVNTEADTALADAGVTPTVMGRLDAAVSTRATPAQVNAEADTALADVGLTPTVTGRIDVAVSSRSSHAAADVWAVGTRTLTGFGTLVADVAAAVWAAATRTLTAFGFTPSTTLSAGERDAIADAYLDRAGAADGLTPREAMRLQLASDAGKTNGAGMATGTGSATIQAVDDSKTRISATMVDNKRSAVTVDVSP